MSLLDNLTEFGRQAYYDVLLTPSAWPPPWPLVNVGGRRPSFGKEITALKQSDRSVLGNVAQRKFITKANDKQTAYRLIDYIAKEASLDLSPPELYLSSTKITEVDPSVLGDAFILKPIKGAGNRGVFCLERRGPDEFYDSARKRKFTWESIKNTYLDERAALTMRNRFSEFVFAEEWLRDDIRGDIPLDYRMFCFFGRCAMIQQRDCNLGMDKASRRARYYNARWEGIGSPCEGKNIDETLSPPPLAKEAVQIAETVSSHLPMPFIRVDLYITPKGVRFGELTPYPGSSWNFIPPVDAALGRLYKDAARRLAKSRYPERDVLMRIMEK